MAAMQDRSGSIDALDARRARCLARIHTACIIPDAASRAASSTGDEEAWSFTFAALFRLRSGKGLKRVVCGGGSAGGNGTDSGGVVPNLRAMTFFGPMAAYSTENLDRKKGENMNMSMLGYRKYTAATDSPAAASSSAEPRDDALALDTSGPGALHVTRLQGRGAAKLLHKGRWYLVDDGNNQDIRVCRQCHIGSASPTRRYTAYNGKRAVIIF
jgi:hypothetical protein